MSGLLLRDRLHRRVRLFGLAANLHVLLLIDQQRQPLTQQWVIVDDEDFLLRALRSLCREWEWSPFSILLSSVPSWEICSDTLVPCVAFRLPTSSLPPIIAAR